MTDTSPTIVKRTLPRGLPNSAYRVREYLTEKEVDRLIETARKRGRNGHRDAAAILLAYRHGLQAWPTGARALHAPLGTDRSQAWSLACQSGEGRSRECASVARSRTSGP